MIKLYLHISTFTAFIWPLPNVFFSYALYEHYCVRMPFHIHCSCIHCHQKYKAVTVQDDAIQQFMYTHLYCVRISDQPSFSVSGEQVTSTEEYQTD